MLDRETGITSALSPSTSGRHGLRITIHRQQAAVFAQALEDRGTVAATAERAVDVDSVGTNRQRLDRLVEQDRYMPRLGHSLLQPRSPWKEKLANASGSPPSIAFCSWASSTSGSQISK